MKLGIIGSRDFSNYELLKSTVLPIVKNNPGLIIVSGGARGADSLAKRFADEYNLVSIIFPAEWDKYGKSAGYKRNVQIVDESDGILAFWDGKSKGTKHSIDIATAKNKPYKIIHYGII